MEKYPILRRILAVLAMVGLVMAVYLLWARPYQLHWGATDKEINRAMPGDELDPHPSFLATRAITINGTPQEIWPWLLQMGYTRAGYYGYDILENGGSPRGIQSAVTILPEFQHFKVGDKVPISPASSMLFYAIEPDRYLIWSGENGVGGFTWALYPVDADHTRLVSRIRWTHHWSSPGELSLDLFTDFTDHLAVRKILEGVKGRVEGHIEPLAVGTTEFAILLAALLVFLAAVILNLLRPFTRTGWLLGLFAGAAWLITWYSPLPIWIGALLELLVLWSLLTFRPSSTPGSTI
jgi:hypothetical protein